MGTPVRSAREMGKYMLIIFLFIGLALCDEEDPSSRREPKLLLVTTATSTTSLTTNTNCYIATAVLGPLTCGRRKKRSLEHLLKEDETSELIAPSRSVAGTGADLEDSKLEGRDPKFLNYFLTVTKTFTFTTHTATSSLASVYCTPAGWSMNACPGFPGKR